MTSINIDKTVSDTCIARFECRQHLKMCSTACPWYIDLKYQLTLSHIPKRHQKFTVATLPDDTAMLPLIKRWSETDLERVATGQGLYLFGTVGVGKTTAACAIAMSYIIHQTLKDIRAGNLTKQLVMFVNVPDLLDTIKRGFDDPEASKVADDILQKLKTVPLAIFDDIGSEKPSEWVRERLLTLIGSRYDDELSTFFTSNLTLPELAEPLGARLRSRIEGMTVPLHFSGQDRRRKL